MTPEQIADNHRFVRDLRETAAAGLKNVIGITAGVIMLLLGLGARGWIKGG